MRKTVERRIGIKAGLVSGLLTASVASAPMGLQAADFIKWGAKKDVAPAAMNTATQRNGFTSAIHKLQEDAKRKAFDGDIDGAIASAQRARKIAEASSSMVSQDPECTVEAADRLVEKLMAVKASTRPPARQVAATLAPRPQPSAPIPPIAATMARVSRPFPSWQRPLTVCSPHPLPQMVQPLPAVAGGWNAAEQDSAAEEVERVAIEDVIQSDERTLSLLMSREPVKTTVTGDSGLARYSAEKETSEEQAESPPSNSTRPALVEEAIATSDSPAVNMNYLQTFEKGTVTATTQAAKTSVEESENRGANHVEVAVAADPTTTVQQVTLSRPSDHEKPAVKPTGYGMASAIGADESTSDAEITVPAILIQDVEPIVPGPSPAVKPDRSASNLPEWLAQWTHLPVGTVAMGLAGVGLVLLGLGLSMARTAIKS